MEQYTVNRKKHIRTISKWFHENLSIEKYPIHEIENWLIINPHPGKFYIHYSNHWWNTNNKHVLLFLDNEEAMTLFKLTWL